MNTGNDTYYIFSSKLFFTLRTIFFQGVYAINSPKRRDNGLVVHLD